MLAPGIPDHNGCEPSPGRTVKWAAGLRRPTGNPSLVLGVLLGPGLGPACDLGPLARSVKTFESTEGFP